MTEIEAAGPGARGRNARHSRLEQEEWRRAGFDLALAQAMVSRPFLAPAPGPAGSRAGSRAGEGSHAKGEPASAAGTGEPAAAAERSPEAAESRAEAAPTDAGRADGMAARGAARDRSPEAEAAPPDRSDGPGESGRGGPPAADAPAATIRVQGTAAAPARGDVEGSQPIAAGLRSGLKPAPSAEAPDAGADARPARTSEGEPSAHSRTAPGTGRPVDVRFVLEDGGEGVLRVSVRGRDVRATITAPDAPTARRLEQGVDDLRRLLAQRGFRRSDVRIRPIPGRRETAAAPEER